MTTEHDIQPATRSDLAMAVECFRKNASVKAVVMAGLLGTVSIWGEGAEKYAVYLLLICFSVTAYCYLLLNELFASLSEKILAADHRVVAEMVNHEGYLKHYDKRNRLLGKIQTACVALGFAVVVTQSI